MTYAVFSDIHGNGPALKTALADAAAYRPDRYLFLGDYTASFPFMNEITDTLRGFGDKAVIIAGNHEGYMRRMREIKAGRQFDPLRWSYDQCTPENRAYLCALPDALDITDGDVPLHLRHDFNPDAEGLTAGVYLFGHSHTPYYREAAGCWFVNPGSCGFSCTSDTRAAYALLTRTACGWDVEQRFVAYDVGAVEAEMKASGFTALMPEWQDVFMTQLRHGGNVMGNFVRMLTQTARARGEADDPVPDALFEEVYETWKAAKQ
jgi:predicted phosphodiesterase